VPQYKITTHKDSNGKMSPITRLIDAISNVIANANASDRNTEKTNNKIANATVAIAVLTFFVVVSGFLTFVVMLLQWMTFEKTDSTIKENERAFVYIDDVTPQDVAFGEQHRLVYPMKIKNGGSIKAVHPVVYAICRKIFDITQMQKHKLVIGPNQTVTIASCQWLIDIASSSAQSTYNTVGVITLL
jgi:hypothetical protein